MVTDYSDDDLVPWEGKNYFYSENFKMSFFS